MSMKVRATQTGYYGSLREEGDEFVIRKKSDLGKWMEPVETSVPKGPVAADGEDEADEKGATDVL